MIIPDRIAISPLALDYEPKIGFAIKKERKKRDIEREKAQHTWPPQGIIWDISEFLMRRLQNKLGWIREDDFVCHAAKNLNRTVTSEKQPQQFSFQFVLPNQNTLQKREQRSRLFAQGHFKNALEQKSCECFSLTDMQSFCIFGCKMNSDLNLL